MAKAQSASCSARSSADSSASCASAHQKKRELATSLLDESHTSAALSLEDLRDLLAP
jgi:hypothetical protein